MRLRAVLRSAALRKAAALLSDDTVLAYHAVSIRKLKPVRSCNYNAVNVTTRVFVRCGLGESQYNGTNPGEHEGGTCERVKDV